MPAPAAPVMSAPEVSSYLDEVFPQIKTNGDNITVVDVAPCRDHQSQYQLPDEARARAAGRKRHDPQTRQKACGHRHRYQRFRRRIGGACHGDLFDSATCVSGLEAEICGIKIPYIYHVVFIDLFDDLAEIRRLTTNFTSPISTQRRNLRISAHPLFWEAALQPSGTTQATRNVRRLT